MSLWSLQKRHWFCGVRKGTDGPAEPAAARSPSLPCVSGCSIRGSSRQLFWLRPSAATGEARSTWDAAPSERNEDAKFIVIFSHLSAELRRLLSSLSPGLHGCSGVWPLQLSVLHLLRPTHQLFQIPIFSFQEICWSSWETLTILSEHGNAHPGSFVIKPLGGLRDGWGRGCTRAQSLRL